MAALLTAVVCLALLGAAIGALLALARRVWAVNSDPLVQAVDARLPQTQCAQCGYPGCRPYAQAIAAGAPINLCPPGGQPLIESLAELLDRPVDAERAAGFDPRWLEPRVALIREADCIGCALCLPACPVDAIIGAPRYMHTVLAAECTGCELCLAPCPVDCIDMQARQGDASRSAA